MYKNKKGGIVGIIITIIILIIIVLLTNVEINKVSGLEKAFDTIVMPCLLYTSPSPRDA